MMPVYAIGDVHGHRAKLEDALSLIEADGGAAARVVLVGDYVDRGPDSAGVIDLLARGLDQGRNWICLKGNHDRMFERFVDAPEPRHDPHLLVGYHWFHDALGGVDTAASYGVGMPERIRQVEMASQLRAAVPERHLRFLRELKLMHREDDLLFVHAGIRPGVPLAQQEENDLLWIRDEFLDDDRDHGVFVVHGHTPVGTPDRRANRLCIDTGAGHGKALSAVVLAEDGIWQLTAKGRVPVR